MLIKPRKDNNWMRPDSLICSSLWNIKMLHVSLWNNPKIMLYQSQTFKWHLRNKTVLCVIKFGTIFIMFAINTMHIRRAFFDLLWSRSPCLWYKRSIYIRCRLISVSCFAIEIFIHSLRCNILIYQLICYLKYR